MALFKSKRQRELENEIKFRQSKAKIRRFVKNARKVQGNYWKLGKQALRLGDTEQFKHLASAYMGTREQVGRWERYLLQLETLGVRREEVGATNEFIDSISALTGSILRGADPGKVADMQAKMEESLARSRALEETLAIVMETSSDSIFGSDELDEGKMADISEAMKAEAEQEEGETYDERIGEGLKRIEEEMRKEMQ